MSRINVANFRHPDATADSITVTSDGDTQINRALGLGGATYGTSGQVLTSAGSGAVPTWTTPSSVIKKIHTFEYATRTGTSTSADNRFTWTSSFTPLDATNNSFVVTASVPGNGANTNFHGVGLRFAKNVNVDFDGYGTRYVHNDLMTIEDYHFVIGPGVLETASNQSIYHRNYSNSSRLEWICPNSTDDARLSQTRAFLTIIEFNNG